MSPAQKAAEAIRAHGVTSVEIAIVLGTGLGALADAVRDAIIIPFADLPGFPGSGVSGHAGRLVCGMLEGRRVAVLQGRAHYYEHGDARAMAVPVETVALLGAPACIATNAAGSTRPDWTPGTLVALADHINYSGLNPLIGETGDARFVSMTDAYDPALRAALRTSAKEAAIDLEEGVYMWFSGPSFETPAEVRMAHRLGADLVGMSTVPEVILARRFGLRVAAVSLVTNLAAGIDGASPSHGETKDMAHAGADRMARLLRGLLRTMP